MLNDDLHKVLDSFIKFDGIHLLIHVTGSNDFVLMFIYILISSLSQEMQTNGVRRGK